MRITLRIKQRVSTVLAAVFLLPETKGKTLAEIGACFRR